MAAGLVADGRAALGDSATAYGRARLARRQAMAELTLARSLPGVRAARGAAAGAQGGGAASSATRRPGGAPARRRWPCRPRWRAAARRRHHWPAGRSWSPSCRPRAPRGRRWRCGWPWPRRAWPADLADQAVRLLHRRTCRPARRSRSACRPATSGPRWPPAPARRSSTSRPGSTTCTRGRARSARWTCRPTWSGTASGWRCAGCRWRCSRARTRWSSSGRSGPGCSPRGCSRCGRRRTRRRRRTWPSCGPGRRRSARPSCGGGSASRRGSARGRARSPTRCRWPGCRRGWARRRRWWRTSSRRTASSPSW